MLEIMEEKVMCKALEKELVKRVVVKFNSETVYDSEIDTEYPEWLPRSLAEHDEQVLRKWKENKGVPIDTVTLNISPSVTAIFENPLRQQAQS
jgi:hypothetical protein